MDVKAAAPDSMSSDKHGPTNTPEVLDAEVFPAFRPLLLACQAYAELSGCRFQRGAFQDLERELSLAMEGGDDLPPLLAAKMCAAPVVEDFGERARCNDSELSEAAHSAYRLVMSESVRSGIVATCRELSLWPPPPSAESIDQDDCSFEDTTAPLPVIAQRAYNDEARREREQVLQPLLRRTVTASFIVDFVVDAGMVMPALSDVHQNMLQEFMARVEEWTTMGAPRQDPLFPAVEAGKRARKALLGGLGAGAAAEELRQGLHAQWSKNWETNSGAAVNVAVAGLAVVAGLASLHRAARKR